MWRGFGQDNSTEVGVAHTRNALPNEPSRHFFRERISSISGMLQSATSKKPRPDSTTNFDDIGTSYFNERSSKFI